MLAEFLNFVLSQALLSPSFNVLPENMLLWVMPPHAFDKPTKPQLLHDQTT